MEFLRKNEINKLINTIRQLTTYNEYDNNTIRRVGMNTSEDEFFTIQNTKLTLKISDRDKLVREHRLKIDDIQNGKYDIDIQNDYDNSIRLRNQKTNETRQKKNESKEVKREMTQISMNFYKSVKESDRVNRNFERNMNYYYEKYLKTLDTIPAYINEKLNKMPNNKGFIWRGIYCFGKLRATRTKLILGERNTGVLYEHEFLPSHHNVWKKINNKRVLHSSTPRKHLN